MPQGTLAGDSGLGTAGASVHQDLRLCTGGICAADQLAEIVYMGHRLTLGRSATPAGVGDLVAAAVAAVPVMPQRGKFFLHDITADGTFVFSTARCFTGGSNPGPFHLHIIVLMRVGGKVGGQYHAAGVGVGGHSEGDGGAAVTAAGAGGPARKHKALVGDGGHRAGGTTLLDQLAGGTGQLAAVGGHKFQRYLGSAHGDGVFGNQVGRYAVRFGDIPQGLRTAVLGNIGMGAHIVEVGCYRQLGQVHTV